MAKVIIDNFNFHLQVTLYKEDGKYLYHSNFLHKCKLDFKDTLEGIIETTTFKRCIESICKYRLEEYSETDESKKAYRTKLDMALELIKQDKDTTCVYVNKEDS